MRRPKRSYADELAEDLRIVRGLREAIAGVAARHKDIAMLDPTPMLDVGITLLEAKQQAAAAEPEAGK